jgi:hypothetical protein
MARKHLIKGANAARVEERISRVPADLGAVQGEAPSIFGALKAMEAEAKAAKPAIAAKPTVAVPPRQRPAARRGPSKTRPPAAASVARIIPIERPEPLKPKPGRIGPSDFTQIEREAILRCCREYRNHLPTYLLAVQKEVRIIDSVIEKCGGNPSDSY